MELRLPDQLVRGIDMTESEWLLDLALGLYVDRRVSLGRCAEIARISTPAFLDALGQRRIPINYDVADFENDLKTIESLESAMSQSKK
jgi:predicted HTH domain antitoxin